MKHSFLTTLAKKGATTALIVVMAVTSFGAFPRQAEATLPVADWLNTAFHVISSIEETAMTLLGGEDFLKEFTLDGIATGVAKAALRSIIVSTLNWVASGFEGSPAFARDLNQTMLRVGDAVATRLVREILQGAINTEFGSRIAQGLVASYFLHTSGDRIVERLQYTLGNFSQNPIGFQQGDFSQGGWNAWYAANSQCGNNVYCAQFAAHDELIFRIDAEVDQQLRELDWGSGFLSWKGNCTVAQNTQTGSTTQGSNVQLTDQDKCLQNAINTPGSVIHAQIQESFGSDIAQLVTADELNEALAGLLNSLLSKAINGDGLAGGAGGATPGLRPGEAPNVAASFSRSLATQKEKVAQYGTNWAKIGNVAEEAEAALQACAPLNAEEERVLEEEVEPTLETATDAQTKAAAALAAIANLEERTIAAAANANVGFEMIIADYQELGASGILPSAQEIVIALQQSSVSPADVEPKSLYSRMVEISEDACSP